MSVMTHKKFALIGACCAALAVFAGAFGAHVLKEQLSSNDLALYETAVKYQFYHAFALIVVGFIPWTYRAVVWAGRLFLVGVLLFCGSLYALALGVGGHLLVWLTPIGGLAFIAGWVSLGYAVWQTRKK